MTCIVGWIEGEKVWIGGDSAGVGGLDMTIRADHKVFRNGPMLFGFTSSFRMGQLLRYAFKVPHHDEDVSVDSYMVTTFINAVRDCLKSGGFASKSNDAESGGTFLVAYKGRLFEVNTDYQVGIPLDGFAAVGCACQVAHGAMFASAHLKGRERVEMALKAAERFSAGVRSPFLVESLP